MNEAIMIIAHGSREKESNQAFLDLVSRFQGFYPEKFVQAAFLELAKPSIPEAIELCVQNGAREIMVMPLMFFPGRHVKTDIPVFIQAAKMKHPELDFHYTGPLADQPGLLRVLQEQAASGKVGRS